MHESAYMFAPTCTHAFKIEPCACDYTYVCLPVRVYVSACVCTSACLCKAHVYVWIHMCACGHAYEICVHMSVHAHYFPAFPPLMTSLRHLPKLGRWPQATPPSPSDPSFRPAQTQLSHLNQNSAFDIIFTWSAPATCPTQAAIRDKMTYHRLRLSTFVTVKRSSIVPLTLQRACTRFFLLIFFFRYTSSPPPPLARPSLSVDRGSLMIKFFFSSLIFAPNLRNRISSFSP